MPAIGAHRIDYSSPRAMTQHGHEHLHSDYARKVEAAMGKALPQMEVRVKNLSLSVQLATSQDNDQPVEVPTIGTILKGGVRGIFSRRAKQQITKPILHSFSGVFEPGTMTLVLGQPGSGKSSLLKLLSGRFPHAKNTTMEGDITYNGVPQAELNKRLPQFVSYVPQRDRHFPTLTVKETLAFAHECCGSELSSRDEAHFTQGSAEENKAALEAARAMYRHYPEIVTQQLGLEHCQDTIVGDSMVRGVSGGERKRVTTGEMEFGNKFVTLMDEISTGLDSAATFDIVKTQRSVARKLRKTVVMALLQPSPEVFDLFDNVLILNDGYVMYHGPREQALPYFESLGFKRPMGRDVADFLMDLGTSQQSKYEVVRLDKVSHPRHPSEFSQCFTQSQVYATTMEAVHADFHSMLRDDMERHVDPVPEFHLSVWAATWLLLKRDLKVTWRNTPYIIGRAVVVVVIGLIYSTLFYKFDPKNVQIVMGTIFPAILFFTLGQTAQLPLFMEAREIFYKQRGANFYRTSSYVVATALNQVPLAFLEVVIFGMLVYWLCGFVTDVWAFLIFEVVLFVTDLAFAAWFFLLSSVTPNLQVTQPIGMMSVLFYILFSGFILTHKNIPDYFSWAYWLNPIAWGMRSLAINEYGDQSFDSCVYDGINYCETYGDKMGIASLKTFDIYTQSEWIWYGVAFMVASFIAFMALAGLALEKMRFEQHESSAAGVATSRNSMVELSTPTSEDNSGEYYLNRTPRATTVDVAVSMQDRHVTPVTVAFENLYYSVPNPTNPKEDLLLLKGISGYAKPGTITALMGSSGAGKTTLMDVIAGRKTGGKTEGRIFLNGHEATDLAIRRSTGYCEQMDIHEDTATFREALTFSAFLRQDASVPAAEKYDTVDEVLNLLDLRPIADQIIRGSSVEQMKRLTIGVELAAQPSVLFLDEPTSGLDARSAKLIMDGVRKVANTGRTVVCTIHQPSAEVFQVFDSLLLLKKGGETVYFGELGRDASELIAYFESIEGVSKLVEGYNPATWMLEVIGAGVGNTAGQDTNFVEVFNASPRHAVMDSTLRRSGFTVPIDGTVALAYQNKRAALESTQAKFLIKRFLDMYWRAADYNLTRFIVNLVLGLIFGLAFGKTEFKSYQGINAGVGMIFTAAVFVGAVAFDSVRPIAFLSRNAFYRERAAQTYNSLWYFVGSTIAEIPYTFASTLLFTAIFFPAVGFTGVDKFLLFWLHLSLLVLLQTYMGQFLAFALPSLEVAATIGIMMTSIFFLFMGFNPPTSLIPSGYKWLNKASPPTYSLAILSSIMFGECSTPTDIGCVVLEDLPATLPQQLTIKQYLETVFSIKTDEIWMNTGIMLGFIVLFRVFALLALRFINHQKK